MRFSGKVVIVTGGASGIGEAIAHKVSQEGANVLVADVAGSAADEVAAAITGSGGSATSFFGDLSEERDAQACVAQCLSQFGRLDILMSNAGVFPAMGEVDTWDIATYDYLVRMNTRPAFLMTKFTLPHLHKSRGNIVYTGSISGTQGSADLAPYGASKGFVIAFMKGVAQEQAKYGVRANAIAPGAIATSWTKAGLGPLDAEAEKMISDVAPMGRLGTPEEMANVCAFLASEEASYVTGSVFVADGGVTPAQGLPGQTVPKELKQLPRPTLPLRHTLDGETRLFVKHTA